MEPGRVYELENASGRYDHGNVSITDNPDVQLINDQINEKVK